MDELYVSCYLITDSVLHHSFCIETNVLFCFLHLDTDDIPKRVDRWHKFAPRCVRIGAYLDFSYLSCVPGIDSESITALTRKMNGRVNCKMSSCTCSCHTPGGSVVRGNRLLRKDLVRNQEVLGLWVKPFFGVDGCFQFFLSSLI